MARINIHIEADSNIDKELIGRVVQALSGQQITVTPALPKVETQEPKVEEPKVETLEPKVDEPKKGKKSTKHQEIKVGEVVDLGQSVPGVTEEELPETIVKETKKEDKKPSITIEQVRTIIADAKKAGKPNDSLRQILKDHGASVVSELNPDTYESVIAAVKAL